MRSLNWPNAQPRGQTGSSGLMKCLNVLSKIIFYGTYYYKYTEED